MNNTIVVIGVIFVIFFVISLVVSVVMANKNKDGQLETKVDKMLFDKHIAKNATYKPETLPKHHVDCSDLEDEELGKCVEVLKPRVVKNVAFAIVMIVLGIVTIYMMGYVRENVEFETTLQYIFELYAPYVLGIIFIIYGLYRLSFLIKNVYFMEKGVIYKDKILRTKKIRYEDVSDTFLGKHWRGGSTSVPQRFGMHYYISEKINNRYVLTFLLDEKSKYSQQNKCVSFSDFDYHDLYEKASNLRSNLPTNAGQKNEKEENKDENI